MNTIPTLRLVARPQAPATVDEAVKAADQAEKRRDMNAAVQHEIQAYRLLLAQPATPAAS